ncbi:MAG: EAL domain-containing protein [Kangiellaceae bacterium]
MDVRQSIDKPQSFDILAVDDDPVSLTVITELMESQGHTVQSFLDAQAAIDSFEKQQPDLILLDIQMPNINGLEACKRIKESKFYNQQPIIFITSSKAEIGNAFDVGGTDYIQKPIEPLELFSRIALHHDRKFLHESLLLRQHELAESNRQLEKLNATLHFKVAQRTRDLILANNKLREEVNERRFLQEKLAFLDRHDFLSRLNNRLATEERLNSILADSIEEQGKQNYYYLMFDIDQFKVINDVHGHFVGDEFLRWLSDSLMHISPEGAFISRLGGDEFSIIFQADEETVEREVKQLVQDISAESFKWDEQQFNLSLSAVIAEVTGFESGGHLISEIESACFTIKNQGGSDLRFYNSTQDKQKSSRLEMAWVPEINSALSHNKFTLHFQRIFDPYDKTIQKAEVLIRLPYRGGIALPGHFIAIAEKYHLISEIDLWVLNKTVSFIKDHPEEFEQLSINVSGETICKPAFLDYVHKLFVSDADLARKLCFEITETSTISNIESMKVFINTLKPFGCQFALDDFGTGLASYAYLKQLSFDYLKVDGMFIKDLGINESDKVMVEAIIKVAHSLDMQVVAEFVESESISEILKDINIDWLQGYHLHKPEELNSI